MAAINSIGQRAIAKATWRIIPLLALLGGIALAVLLLRGIRSGSVSSVILILRR